MQKKLIALAVAGLMSGAAFAQTSVTLGGKFDACYSFTRTGYQAGKTTEALTDGCNSSSRITIGAKETIAPGYDVRVDYDVRFGNVHEGKSGVASNDKKAMAFTTPAGTLQWGTANLVSNEYKLVEKPYMVTPKDTELVKFGVSQLREESLTSRNTSYWSPVLSAGPVKGLVKASFATGDNRKTANSADTNIYGSGDAYSVGVEAVVLDGLLDFDHDYTRRSTSGLSSGGAGGMIYTHTYVSLRPLPSRNLKISASFNTYRGYNPTVVTDIFKEKNTNFVVSYNFDGKAEVGLGISHLNDLGASRNSGRAIMLGGSYFLSKSVQLYAGVAKTNFDYDQGTISGGKYTGTGTNFVGNISKQDSRVVKVGIMKEF
ncbi:porin [Uliginosibacterium paludis]|uniref:Porin n=1 Tax=Uliginosibacterium paludis TaxID=1615952 RepID=A0ABV2CUS1_9RHOO